MKNYNNSILFLRALAVFLVLLFHFQIPFFEKGFLGVDIFFVISGYLLTIMVSRFLDRKQFINYLIFFYLKRVYRIFPALIFVILVSIIFGFFLMPKIYYDNLLKSAIASLIGFSNFYFWHDSVDYFDSSREYKTLLHTWSLSIELQFYLIFPIFLFFLKNLKINKIVAISIIFLFSLFLFELFNKSKFAYFFTITRLWEFLIGSLCYYYLKRSKRKNNYYFIGLCLILYSILNKFEFEKIESINNIFATIGTSLIIISNNTNKFYDSLFQNSFIKYLGKISYSLYLVHWVIISLINYYFIYELTLLYKLLFGFISIIISHFVFIFFESKYRYSFYK